MEPTLMGVAFRITTSAPAPVGGHGRGVEPSAAEPRVPIIGVDSGAIPGTKPGCSARELERAGRDIVRARMHRNRWKRPPEQVK